MIADRQRTVSWGNDSHLSCSMTHSKGYTDGYMNEWPLALYHRGLIKEKKKEAKPTSMNTPTLSCLSEKQIAHPLRATAC